MVLLSATAAIILPILPDKSTMEDYTERFSQALNALAEAQRVASALWDEMEEELPVEALERALAAIEKAPELR
jgi:hypothetical protein